MRKAFLLICGLCCPFLSNPVVASEKPDAKPQHAEVVPSHSICDNLEKSLSHLNDDKAKSIITAFCAVSSHGGDAAYIDKLQVTINIQGNDATYTEKYKYKDNFGTKNKYTSPDDEDCPLCKKEADQSLLPSKDPSKPEPSKKNKDLPSKDIVKEDEHEGDADKGDDASSMDDAGGQTGLQEDWK